MLRKNKFFIPMSKNGEVTLHFRPNRDIIRRQSKSAVAMQPLPA